MTTVAPAPPESEDLVETERVVTPLELFFDLVFVYAITQVTTLWAATPTWAGLGRGMLVLAALWWTWVAYSWLTTTVDAEAGATRAAMLAAMAAMLVASLAAPGAFGRDALAFGLAYTAVRLLHILVYALATDDVDVRAAVRRLAPTVTLACGLIVAAAALHGGARVLLWCAALAIDYGGVWVRGVSGWTLSPAHFAERHGDIVIIALGESIAAVGVGATGQRVDVSLAIAATLGLAIAAALWWAYFDVVARVAARRLRRLRGEARIRMARDSYTFLHLPLVTGIVLIALGVKKTLAHEHTALETVPAVALCGGAALYLCAHVAFRARNLGTLNRQRLAAALACLALIPVATAVQAVVALALVAAVLTALIAYEALRFREARARMRSAPR
jgi:low temperature requirement protein LtrA